MDNINMPQVSVGIMNEPAVDFVLNGRYKVGDAIVTGLQHAVAVDGKVSWNGYLEKEISFVPADDMEQCSFELHDVTIGVNFHWERKENQLFRGVLKLIVENGKVTTINVLPVEDYLMSVISLCYLSRW